MFLVACKTAVVEALRSIWFDGNQDPNLYRDELGPNDAPLPRRITIEYPEEPEDWPFVLVQVRPTVIEWTGIMPDEIVDSGTDDAPVYKLIRQGRFEATCMLQVMATESLTRDRIWDNLVNVLLMGRKKAPQNRFFNTISNHDLVGLTVMEGSVRNVGDTISMGTPWDPELLTYESSIEFDLVGTFYADEYTEHLVPLEHAMIFEYIEGSPPPFEQDLNIWSANLVEGIDRSTDPVINVQLDTEIPDYLIVGSQLATIGADTFTMLEQQWLAKIEDEDFIVLMVGDVDKSLVRVSRAQFDTVPRAHQAGATFKHGGTSWKTWMA